MQRILAIAMLTWKAAFRYRLFWVMAFLLAATVSVLPLLIKHDGTARGFVQIVLTYTLSLVTVLLGMATLWLGCGTLARDIEECQIQVVVTKPIARWQIWVGKWAGIMSLNAALLLVAGASIYVLLQWRARQLPPPQQIILRNEVLVARATLKEPAPDFAKQIEENFQQRIRNQNLTPADQAEVRKQVEEAVKGREQLVPPGYMRRWQIDATGIREKLKGAPLYLRVKFYAAETSPRSTYLGAWRIGPAESPMFEERVMSLAPETFHEFAVPAQAITDDGKLIVNFVNRNECALLFPLADGFEVLYREASFELNLLRGLVIIWFWLGLLACVGLAAASFLSFPVAAFVALAALAMVVGGSTMTSAVEDGTVFGRDHETGAAENPVLDKALLPVFKAVVRVINLAEAFSPVDLLSSGRSVGWGLVAQAFVQVILLLGGSLAAVGITLFNRRELAAAQNA
jgi:hypothetical protein